ncbi:cell division protein FtsA, partial [Liquorilactobacillus mali KCTC 3596 = DSM 20444]
TGPKTVLHNTVKCVERAGLVVKDTIVAPLALATQALSDGEQDFGAVLIDLGGGQTTAAVVHDHKLKYTYVDQEGGKFVTKDISVVLNTSIENAEKIKRNFGYAASYLASKDDVFPVEVVGKTESVQISGEYLSEIIEARLTQIFMKLKDVLEEIDALKLPGGIIITGGVSALPGIKELAEDIFETNIKLFIPQQMGLRHPSFTQAIGLVAYMTKQTEIEKVVKSTLSNSVPEIGNNTEVEAQEQQLDYNKNTVQKKQKIKKNSSLEGIKNFFNTFFD